ncbi:hypothetical protein C464_00994 [Halorubrum coriense DSM 10284]|uniref:Uncharacterized protein n=1 Tax=Halorubrum coriense DSM 10284 TaxID=1227466 RepID=M0EX59_9EURY|nr:hypothetical protein C464_00994 [Halorubrum coriense DSM 10284]
MTVIATMRMTPMTGLTALSSALDWLLGFICLNPAATDERGRGSPDAVVDAGADANSFGSVAGYV